jgi:hypothetical protein
VGDVCARADNEIGEEGARALAAAMEQSTVLTMLDLSSERAGVQSRADTQCGSYVGVSLQITRSVKVARALSQ